MNAEVAADDIVDAAMRPYAAVEGDSSLVVIGPHTQPLRWASAGIAGESASEVWTRSGQCDGLGMGRINSMAAGRAMAFAAARALRQGVNIRAVNDEIAHLGGRTGVAGKRVDLEKTEEQIAELKRRASRARGLAAAATNDEVQADYEADAEKYTAAAQALRRQLRHRQTAAQQPREVERMLEVNVGRVVWALSHLARTSTVSAYSEVYAIRNIIPRVMWQPDGLLMRGTFVIHVSQQGRLSVVK